MAIRIAQIIFFALTFSSALAAQSPDSQLLAQTIAGNINLIRWPSAQWQLEFHQQIILTGQGVAPNVLKHIKRRFRPFDEVIILHRVEGSYCNGGTIWFLGIQQLSRPQISEPIGQCFAAKPRVVLERSSIKVVVRGGYGNNRLPREPYIAGGVWCYRNGQVRKLKVSKSRFVT